MRFYPDKLQGFEDLGGRGAESVQDLDPEDPSQELLCAPQWTEQHLRSPRAAEGYRPQPGRTHFPGAGVRLRFAPGLLWGFPLHLREAWSLPPTGTVMSHSHSSDRNLSTLPPRNPAPFCGLCSLTVCSPIETSYKLFLTVFFHFRRGESCAVTISYPENEIPKNLIYSKNYLLLFIYYLYFTSLF